MADERTEQLRADSQAYVDKLSTETGLIFDRHIAGLIRRAYMEGRSEGVAWAQKLIHEATR